MISDPNIGHAPDQGEIDVPSQDYDIPLAEESSAGLMDMDTPFANLTCPIPDSSQKVSMEGFESTLLHAPLTETLKVPIEPPSVMSLPVTVTTQPPQEIFGHLAQLLSQAKIFTSRVVGVTRCSLSSFPSPLLSDQLH